MASPAVSKWALRRGEYFEDISKCRDTRHDVENVMFTEENVAYIWDNGRSCFRCFLTTDDGACSAPLRSKTLICSNPPVFTVHSVIKSNHGLHVAVVGKRGVTVVELPKLCGRLGIFDETNGDQILCKSISIDQRLFDCWEDGLYLKKVRWHPAPLVDTHLIILTSNNELRIYDIRQPDDPVQYLKISEGLSKFAAALGEVPVSFDVGRLPVPAVELWSTRIQPIPAAATDAWPIYILTGTGDVYVTYSCLQRLTRQRGLTLEGPLPMFPSSYDNYGVDACDILCMATCPAVLALATCSGTVYHCVLLQNEKDDGDCFNSDADEDDLQSRSRYSSRHGSAYEGETGVSTARESLYVYDSIRLELTLATVQAETDEVIPGDFACPIHLISDPVASERYHCYHAAGVHTIFLPWIEHLEQMSANADAGEEDCDAATTHWSTRATVAEHIVCTKPLAEIPSEPMLGLAILDGWRVGVQLVCLFGDYSCHALPLRSPETMRYTSCREESMKVTTMPSQKGSRVVPFNEHIRNSLLAGKPTSNPFMKLSDSISNSSLNPQQCFQLLARATVTFREQHVQRLVQIKGEIDRRIVVLRALKNQQQRDLDNIRASYAQLAEGAENLAIRFEDTSDQQENYYKRLSAVMTGLQARTNVPSDADAALAKALRQMAAHVKEMTARLCKISRLARYQKDRELAPPHNPDATNALSATQCRHLKSILAQEQSRIAVLIGKIKHMDSLVDT